jgi:hypothetical protein
MKVVYGDAPTDPLQLAAMQYLQVSYVAEHSIMVQSPLPVPEITAYFTDELGVTPTIEKVGG